MCNLRYLITTQVFIIYSILLNIILQMLRQAGNNQVVYKIFFSFLSHGSSPDQKSFLRKKHIWSHHVLYDLYTVRTLALIHKYLLLIVMLYFLFIYFFT